MRWQEGRRSENVEDRRGVRVGTGVALGGGTVLLIALVVTLMGGDPGVVLDVLNQQPQVSVEPRVGAPGGRPRADDQLADFVSVILADTEDTWKRLFAERGQQYSPPVLVLFSDAVESACGFTSAAVGPFYCPADRRLYIDLGFYRELRNRFGAPGDFAQAYVVAHEVGHHVQNLLGISGKVEDMSARLSEVDRRALSVRVELQADCLAGVWGHHAGRQRDLLEAGDVEEGLAAAAAIGDDCIQRQAGGRVSPESWTHGSSEQRVRWFRRGLERGDLTQCDTFSLERP